MLIFLLLLSYSSCADEIKPDVRFIVGNETYSVNQTISFSEIKKTTSGDLDTWIEFNSTVRFSIDSTNDINITLVYLHSNVAGAVKGSKVLEFYANTTSGRVWFNLSGFSPSDEYTIQMDGVAILETTAESTGNISFNNSIWSKHLFEIVRNSPPDAPTPFPVNNSVVSPALSLLKVLATDTDNDTMDISFYWSDGTVIDIDSIANNSYASVIVSVRKDTRYWWYVIITDDEGATTRGPVSGNWTFIVRDSSGGLPDEDVEEDEDKRILPQDDGRPWLVIIVIAIVIIVTSSICIVLYKKR